MGKCQAFLLSWFVSKSLYHSLQFFFVRICRKNNFRDFAVSLAALEWRINKKRYAEAYPFRIIPVQDRSCNNVRCSGPPGNRRNGFPGHPQGRGSHGPCRYRSAHYVLSNTPFVQNSSSTISLWVTTISMSFSSSLVKKRSSLDSALIRISGMVSSSSPNTTITIRQTLPS